MRKIIVPILGLLTVAGLLGCQPKKTDTITVGAIDGPDVQLLETAAEVAKQRYGLNVKIVSFSDYNTPNSALNDGSIDANMFQHQPFLDEQIKNRGYQLKAIGKTYIFPMGIYSRKITDIAQVKDGDLVAIPSDPSNEARALLLLQNAHLITLRPGATENATIADIADNPKHLKIVELEAPQLPRSLDDVTLAAINSNFAVSVGLSPVKDSLFREGPDSPYANIVVVRVKDENDPRFRQLVEALQSQEVQDKAKQLFGDNVIPAF